MKKPLTFSSSMCVCVAIDRDLKRGCRKRILKKEEKITDKISQELRRIKYMGNRTAIKKL